VTTIKAKPVWGDKLEKNVSSASNPPAEAPMPTTGSAVPSGLSDVLWRPFFVTDGFHRVNPCFVSFFESLFIFKKEINCKVNPIKNIPIKNHLISIPALLTFRLTQRPAMKNITRSKLSEFSALL